MEHHAYYFEGSQSDFDALVGSACKEFGVAKDSPDLHVLQYEKFGIDDAHELTRQASLKSVNGRALFVVGISITNVFAQQALLKLLEEPQPGVVFVLLVPPGTLMPTIKSRLLPYPEGKLEFDGQKTYSIENPKLASQKVLGSPVSGKTHRGPDHFASQVLDFLKAPYKERSTQITALLKDDEGVRERVRDFVNGLEVSLHAHSTPATRAGLEDISKVRSYLGDQSPSLKMMLEHLAATLPKL